MHAISLFISAGKICVPSASNSLTTIPDKCHRMGAVVKCLSVVATLYWVCEWGGGHRFLEMNIAPWDEHCSLRWALFLEMSIVPWDEHCSLRWALFLEMSIVPWDEHCSLRWALLLEMSIAPWDEHCSLRWKSCWGEATDCLRWTSLGGGHRFLEMNIIGGRPQNSWDEHCWGEAVGMGPYADFWLREWNLPPK